MCGSLYLLCMLALSTQTIVFVLRVDRSTVNFLFLSSVSEDKCIGMVEDRHSSPRTSFVIKINNHSILKLKINYEHDRVTYVRINISVLNVNNSVYGSLYLVCMLALSTWVNNCFCVIISGLSLFFCFCF